MSSLISGLRKGKLMVCFWPQPLCLRAFYHGCHDFSQRTFLVSTTQKPGAPAELWGKPPARSWDAHGARVGKVEIMSTEACRRSALRPLGFT